MAGFWIRSGTLEGIFWKFGPDSGADEGRGWADRVGEGGDRRRFGGGFSGTERVWARAEWRLIWRGARRRQSGAGICGYGEGLVSD